ncbi:integrase catalytic domain-containing protein [Trichonephila clavipes]|nr:integrase catalytic domain-containing protein [Trichonephila clavipes]
MLNSRPLVPLSSDLDDLNVLTPSHFLIGRSITSIVEPDLTDLNENRLDNWQKITKIIQLIWKRWSVDYLNSLQQRNKWHFEKKNAKIGDMVIIKEDNLPSCQWSLGRINNIYPGKDSKVRVVEVKTTRGRYNTKPTLVPKCPLGSSEISAKDKRFESLHEWRFTLKVLLLYSAASLYAPALALSAVTNLSMDMSIILMGVVCTFYCTLVSESY